MSSISRRHFIRLGAAASSLSLLPSIPVLAANDPWNKRRGTRQNVLILGAGMAGLSAAMELRNLGHSVTVLEGQMRAGGRVQTLRHTMAPGLYADLGAARIPINHDWTMKYIEKYGLKLHAFNPEEGDWVHHMRGKAIRFKWAKPPAIDAYPAKLTQEEISMGMNGVGQKLLAPMMSQLGDPTALDWPTTDIGEYDLMGMRELAEKQGLSPDVAAVLNLGWEEPDMPDTISSLEMCRELALNFGKKRFKILGGNDLLPTKMAEELAGVIQYGTRVVDLQPGDEQVKVLVDKRGAVETLTADRVICTFPLPIVRQMGFVDSLSPGLRKAIKEFGYFNLSRTIMQVDDRYWKKEGLNGSAVTDLPCEIWDPLYEQEGKRGLIAAYIKARDSDKLHGKSQEEKLKFSANHVNEIFPGLHDHLEGGFTKVWSEDPWFQTAHSLGQLGDMTEHLPHLLKPEGRIYFAGEHASAYHGWIQGAIESGNRAAKAINSF